MSETLRNLTTFRIIYRSTWAKPSIPNVTTRLAFLLGETNCFFFFLLKKDIENNFSGSTPDGKLQAAIDEENLSHHDIIQGDFLDTYRNLSYKNIMGKLWVSEFCQAAQLVIKTDDDQYVDLYGVGL